MNERESLFSSIFSGNEGPEALNCVRNREILDGGIQFYKETQNMKMKKKKRVEWKRREGEFGILQRNSLGLN